MDAQTIQIDSIPDGEYILCSAIWVCSPTYSIPHKPINIDTGLVVAGYRHSDCLTIITLLNPSLVEGHHKIQGFLTSRNRFVNRREAKEIAVKHGQCIDDERPELYSEDLYTNNFGVSTQGRIL